MQKYFARDALLPAGWARDVRISVEGGDIVAVEPGSSGGDALHGAVLPGMANLHSHAFQRGMAGMAEVRGQSGNSADDDFWTWRELMYRFVERVTPEQAQAIALHLYIEMLKHGYTAVAEFNYLNSPEGMLDAHLDAARAAGIAITALPSLYRWSGFGQQPLKPRQKRFDSDVRSIVDAFRSVPRTQDERAGVAPHSLRAVDPGALRELVAEAGDAPIHIHAAEQTKEVEDCRRALGQRPVEWLLSSFAVDERWCIVHATHMVDEETRGLARSGAVAGLCPTTEGNLGDGIFPLLEYRAAGGRYGIGGDSHVSRDPAEELRLLEYVQRLTARKRNLVVGKSPAVGTTLWLEAAAGGAQAMGRAMGAIAPGKRADLVVIDTEQRGDGAANELIFSGTRGLVRDVMVGGEWVVRERRHGSEEAAAESYRRAVKALVA
ncbi:MAG TPA: formimidoylglutamate deiminase [Burkholderiales bacterium]|nr:formimidoylglutamate deiminase [Burkholderiales bacterium]